MRLSFSARRELNRNLGELFVQAKEDREDTLMAFTTVWATLPNATEVVKFLVDHADMTSDKAEVAVRLFAEGKLAACLDVLRDTEDPEFVV